MTKSPKRRKPLRLFVSYAQEDAAFAAGLRDALGRSGKKLNLVGDCENPGEHWLESLDDELRDTDVMIPILTPESAHSRWVLFEIGAAYGLGKRILPVLNGDLDMTTVPLNLLQRQVVRADGPEQAAEAIARILSEETA